MPEQPSPLDKATEMEFEVRALTDQAIDLIGRGGVLAGMVGEESVRRVLDYLVTADMTGSDFPDLSEEMKLAVDEADRAWQDRVRLMTEEERDALAHTMLESLVDSRLSGRIKFSEEEE